VETAVAAVRSTRGRLASWFVLGSNDYYVPRARNPLRYFIPRRLRKHRYARRGRSNEMRALLSSDGWRDLTNLREETDLGGLRVELLGLDDAHIRRQDLRVAPRRSPSRFGIAVMHSPDSAPEIAACGYPFVVAGHTHGGQVRLPLVGALVTNSHLPRRLVSGLIRMGGSFVHVSPGLGTSKYAPFRFLCPPEATLLELRRAKAVLFPIDWPEPFGLVMTEAMACGTPVIATPRGSVPEVVEDGVTGWIVDVEDFPAQAAERLARLSEIDPHACRDRVQRLFSKEAMVAGYEAAFGLAAAGR